MIKKGPKARSINQNRVGVILEGRNLRLDPTCKKSKTASSEYSDDSFEDVTLFFLRGGSSLKFLPSRATLTLF